MDLQLHHKVALVFGGSKGIGFGIAKALAQEGAQVVIAARHQERLNAAAKEIGAIDTMVADLSKPGAAQACVAQVIEKFGALHVLVINSGGPTPGSFEKVNSAAWSKAFDELWLSGTEAIQQALKTMRQQRFGRILWITSLSAKEPIPALTLSNGLRAGLIGLVKSLSNEVAADGITVNSILPGFIDTERLAELGYPKGHLEKEIPAQRLGTTDELGQLAAFLSSPQAGYITGQAIAIDGGRRKGF